MMRECSTCTSAEGMQAQRASRCQCGTAVLTSPRPPALCIGRYIAALVARLPTLSCIQLTDYMGLVDPASLAAGQAQHGGKPGAAAAVPAAAATAAAGKEAGPGSRAGSPGLVMQHEAGGAASSLAGWQRAVAETPVPGGISGYDLTYSRASRRQ